MKNSPLKSFIERYTSANERVKRYSMLVPVNMNQFDESDQWNSYEYILDEANENPHDSKKIKADLKEAIKINNMFHKLLDFEKIQTGLKQLECWVCENILYQNEDQIGAIGFSIDVVEDRHDQVIKTISGVQCTDCFMNYQIDTKQLKAIDKIDEYKIKK